MMQKSIQWFHAQTCTESQFQRLLPTCLLPSVQVSVGLEGTLLLPLPCPQRASWADTSKFPPFQKCCENTCLLVFMLLLSSLLWVYIDSKGFPWWLSGKESTCQCRTCDFDPWVEKIPWRREWQPTPVSLPGKSCGPRSLEGYSPQKSWA